MGPSGLTPDDMQQVSFSMERDGYDSNIVDGLLEDIANVAHQGVVPADLRPTPPPSYRGDGGLPARRG